MATANNYDTLVGGQIIYAFGYSGVSILGPIVVGDLTTVTNRGLFQGLYNLPSLFNIFVAPRAAALLLDQGRWRWGYGLCCIILGGTAVPLIGGLWYVHFKLKRSGLIEEYKAKQAETEEPKMNIFQKFIWLMTEIDIVGSLLLIAGLCLILLPLVLALPKWGGWSSGITIGTLVAGVVAWILFAIWEWKFARKPIIPLARWNTHTPLLGVLALSTVTLISSTNWQYFTTYLLVSRKVSIDTAIYLERGYNVAYIVCEVTVGYLMKRTRKWRPFVWAGVSLTILGVGLMIPARLPSSSDAFVVISQTIVGIGSGCLYTPILVAIQSSVPHSDLAVVTAMMQVGGSIAASVGSTMSGAIWNSMLPGQLAKYVPGEYDYAKIVGSTDYAISLPKEQYDGVVQAYGHIQMILSIIAICIAVLTFCFTVPMKSFGLEDAKDSNDTTSLKETPVEDYKSSSTTKL
ncbi:MFS general substrate transporter [Rhizopus microsporus var. microsporus]|nr:MFS general substrate transporter [Rhizopus microsporus var. microsporus]